MWVVLLLVAPVFLTQTSGFVIRARDLVDDDLITDDSSLSEALRVLEREKRRLDDEASYRDFAPGFYDNWNNGDEDDSVDLGDDGDERFELESADNEDGEDISSDIANYLATMLKDRPEGSNPPDDTEEEDEEIEDEFPPQGEFSPEQVSIDELKDIFNVEHSDYKTNKASQMKKKTPEVEDSLLGDRERLRESIEAEKQKSKSKKSIPHSSIDLENLSRPQIQELLNEVDKLQRQEVLHRQNEKDNNNAVVKISEIVEEEDEGEPVTEEELEEVFNEDYDGNERKENEEVETLEDELEEDSPSFAPDEIKDTGKEWISDDSSDAADNRIKRLAKRDYKKKSSQGANTSYAMTISRLLDIIGKLRLQNLLENKEIDSLADALDIATNSQAKQSLGQLPQELKSLQHAIKIEESLQGGASELSDDDKTFLHNVIEQLVLADNVEGDTDVFEDTEDTVKRSDDLEDDEFLDGDAADESGKWYEEPIVSPKPAEDEEYDTDGFESDDDEEQAQEAKETLKDLLNQYRAEEMLANIPGGDPETDDVQNEADGDEDDLLPVEDLTQDDEEERDQPPSYSEALGRLFRDEVVDEATQREIAEALAQFSHNVEPWQRRELENRIRDYQQCSPLDSLVSDCRLADELSIPLDDEARELCSRHEACYACGGDLGKAAGQCDAGYLAEALQLCNGIEKCNIKADAFLRLLQYYHRYSTDSKGECEHQCVVDYIYGVTV